MKYPPLSSAALMVPLTGLHEYRPKRPPSGQRFAVLHDVSSSYMKLLSQDEAAESGELGENS